MAPWPHAGKWPNGHTIIKSAVRDDTVWFNNHIVSQNRIREDAVRANHAASADFCPAQQLNAWFDHAVLAGRDFGIDKNSFRQLNGDAIAHQGIAFPFAEYAIDLGKIRARIAAEHLAGIRRNLRQDVLPFRGKNTDGVRQIDFTMLVIRFYLCKRGPKFIERKTVDARIDFVDVALLFGELRFFGDGANLRFGFSDDTPITARIVYHRA